MPVSTLEAKSLYICFFFFSQHSNLNSKIKEEKEDKEKKQKKSWF
jgi:hypothetical protein